MGIITCQYCIASVKWVRDVLRYNKGEKRDTEQAIFDGQKVWEAEEG